jgi:hypothetical protein
VTGERIVPNEPVPAVPYDVENETAAPVVALTTTCPLCGFDQRPWDRSEEQRCHECGARYWLPGFAP